MGVSSYLLCAKYSAKMRIKMDKILEKYLDIHGDENGTRFSQPSNMSMISVIFLLIPGFARSKFTASRAALYIYWFHRNR